jgi:hypothetical protein
VATAEQHATASGDTGGEASVESRAEDEQSCPVSHGHGADLTSESLSNHHDDVRYEEEH